MKNKKANCIDSIVVNPQSALVCVWWVEAGGRDLPLHESIYKKIPNTIWPTGLNIFPILTVNKVSTKCLPNTLECFKHYRFLEHKYNFLEIFHLS